MRYGSWLLCLIAVLPAWAGQSEFVLHPYVVGIRHKGPAWTADMNSPESKRILAGHIAVIKKMTATGKLVAAGPFANASELRGMLIFRDCTVEQAREMANEDPAVRSGRIVIEFHTWMATPGLRAEVDAGRKSTVK